MNNHQPQQGQPQGQPQQGFVPQPGFVPGQGFVPQPQPKKKHRGRNFLIVAAVVVGVIVVAAQAGGGNSGTSGTSSPTLARNEPRPVTVGTAFTIGKHQLNAGWALSYQEYLGSKVTGTVTNVSNKTSSAIFHIKFLKGGTVVGNLSCTSNDLEPGQSEAVECLNTVSGGTDLRQKGAYTKVTAEATF